MSENKDDFVSFENALRDLKMQSEELKKLVSEGDIRAYRDGASMKFKKEDIDALTAKKGGESELVFADALEDDAGMVTEELSDEDTLLAEDVVEDKAVTMTASKSVSRTSRRDQITSRTDAEKAEPKWVIAVSVLCSVAMVYGMLVIYNISTEAWPDGLTSMFQHHPR